MKSSQIADMLKAAVFKIILLYMYGETLLVTNM